MAGFDMSAAFAAKSSAPRIEAGVYNAKFVSIKKDNLSTVNGDTEVLALTIDVENHGEYTQNFFKPLSTERKDGTWGPQPSEMENFQILLREIIEAINPNYAADIQAGKLKLSGNFAQIVNAVGKWAEEYVGNSFKVKFLPQKNGYCSIPSYVAAIARDGKTLRISNLVLGTNVSLTASEQKKIKAAAAAAASTPTEMPAVSSDDLLGSVAADLDVTPTTGDLPF